MHKIKKDDMVKIIAGKDKDKTARRTKLLLKAATW